MGVSTDVTERKRAEQELRGLDIVREVQQQLLPRSNRAFPALDLAAACVPTYELGGDFFDFLPYGNGRLALALGDVSGKGTAAALLAALTTEHTPLITNVQRNSSSQRSMSDSTRRGSTHYSLRWFLRYLTRMHGK